LLKKDIYFRADGEPAQANLENLRSENVLYRCGVPSKDFIMILDGRARVVCTNEQQEYEAGPFCFFGKSCLMDKFSEKRSANKRKVSIDEREYLIVFHHFSLSYNSSCFFVYTLLFRSFLSHQICLIILFSHCVFSQLHSLIGFLFIPSLLFSFPLCSIFRLILFLYSSPFCTLISQFHPTSAYALI